MFSKTLFAIAVFASAALAQSGTETSSAAAPTSTAGIDQCILNCIEPAAAAVGCSFTDTSCVCASTEFQNQATACLQQNCTAAEIQAALQLQEEECAGVSASGSASATGSATTEASSAAETTSAAATSASASGTTSKAATSTAPATTATRASTTSAAAATTTNAALGRGESMGLVGLMVAGVFGLVL